MIIILLKNEKYEHKSIITSCKFSQLKNLDRILIFSNINKANKKIEEIKKISLIKKLEIMNYEDFIFLVDVKNFNM